jgi:hypothetical protein
MTDSYIMEHTDFILEDDRRWSNDFSPVEESLWLWLFTNIPETNNSSPAPPPTHQSALHVYNRATQDHRIFALNVGLCKELALLDLDYWSNVASSQQNSHRLSRYLEKLREDVQKEMQKGGTLAKQPDCLIPWAVRTKLHFGHSVFGRTSYKKRCDEEKLVPYMHNDPIKYGIF